MKFNAIPKIYFQMFPDTELNGELVSYFIDDFLQNGFSAGMCQETVINLCLAGF